MTSRNNFSIKQRILITALCTIFAGASLKVKAQNSLQDTTLSLDEIVVSATKMEQSVSETGRSVSVITRREIEESTYVNVGQILAQQKGIHMVGSGQTPGALQSAFMRNADSDQVVVMIDGIRISDPSSVDNTVNLAELSLANVQRIEVVRGSHSTLYGSSAVGGVINIITKGGQQPGINAAIDIKVGGFGEGTSTLSENSYLNFTSKSGFYTNISTVWESTEGMDATTDTLGNSPQFSTSDQDDFDKLDLTGKAGYTGKNWNGYVAYRRVDQEVDVDNGSFSDDDNAFADFQRHLFTYGASKTLSEHLKLQYVGGYSTLDRLNMNDSSRINASGNFDGSVSRTSTDATLLENELRTTLKTDNVSTIVGLNSSRQTMNIKQLTIARNFNFFQQTNLDSLNLDEVINSFFFHTEINGGVIGEGFERFSIGAGLRLLDHDQFGFQSTFEVNPQFTISDQTTAFAAISSGFNAPSLFQLESPAKSFGEITNLGNKALDPETSISYEVGVRQSLGSRFNVDLSLFTTKIDDAIEFVNLWNGETPIDELSFADFRGDTYLNASKKTVKGLEFGFDARISPGISFWGDLTAASSELQFSPSSIDQDQTGGNRVQIFESGEFVQQNKEIDGLTRRPSVSGTVGAEFQVTNNVGLMVNSTFVGSRDDVFFSSTLGPFGALDREELSGYNLTNITVNYDITQSLRVTGKIDNLFDSQYQEIRGFNTRNRGFYLRMLYKL